VLLLAAVIPAWLLGFRNEKNPTKNIDPDRIQEFRIFGIDVLDGRGARVDGSPAENSYQPFYWARHSSHARRQICHL
jgi:hypothetical protein